MSRELAQHPRGERIEVLGHACPQCDLASPKPFCSVCLGSGLATTDRLAAWQREQNDLMAAEDDRIARQMGYR